jgi:hypothetical protein
MGDTYGVAVALFTRRQEEDQDGDCSGGGS